jgi:hypothetical protein
MHRLSGTLVQAGVYQQQLSNLTLLVGFIHAHKHAQEVLREHIQVRMCGIYWLHTRVACDLMYLPCTVCLNACNARRHQEERLLCVSGLAIHVADMPMEVLTVLWRVALCRHSSNTPFQAAASQIQIGICQDRIRKTGLSECCGVLWCAGCWRRPCVAGAVSRLSCRQHQQQ